MENEINFKNNNPGAVRYGNFINYYNFNSAENRIKLFPTTNIWQKYLNEDCICLDIGCNAGNLTTLLLEFLNSKSNQKNYFLGIDIDPILIQRATETNKNLNSIEFKCLDIMNDDNREIISNYLQKHNRKTFNISFCLSITMWIHLNHGDDGLKKFLTTVCDYSEMVVIEPQPWKCYKTAVKRLKQANAHFPLFQQIVNKQNVENYIRSVLENCGFVNIYETKETAWERKILFYERK